MDKNKAEYIRNEVSKAMGYSMEGFSFHDIIDCADTLTKAQKKWAKKHLDWVVVNLDNEPEK